MSWRIAPAWLQLAVRSVVAGAALGVVEIGSILSARGSAVAEAGIGGVAALASGVFALSIVAAGIVVLAVEVVRYPLARVPGLTAWWQGIRRPGPCRVTALYRGVVVACAASALAYVTLAVSLWTQWRFHEPGPIALLQAAVVTLLALVLVAAAATAMCRVPTRLMRCAAADRWTRGARAAALSAVTSVAAVWLLAQLLMRAAPQADFRVPAIGALSIALVLLLSALGLDARLGRRKAGFVTAAGAVLTVAGLGALAAYEYPRGAIAADGAVSRATFISLVRMNVAGGGADVATVAARANERPEHRLEPQETAYPESRSRKNAILITVDALRPDHMSAYGYERPTTPRLEALAERGTRFSWAITPSPTTRRAIPSTMAARYPSTLTWQDIEWVRVEVGAHELLSGTFQEAGYDTAAIHCCTTLFDEEHGMEEGFDLVDASADEIGRQRDFNADVVADNIVDFVEGRGEGRDPFFLWSHIIDPHYPYLQVPGAPDFGDEDIDRYDSQIAFVDAQIGRILDALEDEGIRDETVVAVTSDHGQEFGEHGGRFHGRTLYNEVMRVPLIVYDPAAERSARAQRVSEPVSVIDVGPTLLDLSGLDRPRGQNGVSLAKAVRDGDPPPARMILGELIADHDIDRNLLAGWRYPWKIIWDLDARSYELYALGDDPFDQKNLRHRESAAFREVLDEFRDVIGRELSPLPWEME